MFISIIGLFHVKSSNDLKMIFREENLDRNDAIIG